MKRKHKIYSRPKRPFDKQRLIEEGEIKKKFGLKNKTEIWKAEAKIKSIREKAKRLISSDGLEQQKLFNQLKKIGFDVNSIGDVLSLEKGDYLNRRLQTVVLGKKLANTVKEARQLIVHKKILVDGQAINSPSYIVPVKLEGKITVRKRIKKPKQVKEETKEEVVEEVKNE